MERIKLRIIGFEPLGVKSERRKNNNNKNRDFSILVRRQDDWLDFKIFINFTNYHGKKIKKKRSTFAEVKTVGMTCKMLNRLFVTLERTINNAITHKILSTKQTQFCWTYTWSYWKEKLMVNQL